MKLIKKAWILGCVFLLGWSEDAAAKVDVSVVEQMPVQHMGRVKPFYAFSQQTWQAIYGKSHWKNEAGEKVSALDVAVDVWLHPDKWPTQEIIYVNYTPLRESLGMEEGKKHASWLWLVENSKLREYINEVQNKKQLDPKAKLDRLEQEVQNVVSRLEVAREFLDGSLFKIISNPESAQESWTSIDRGQALYDSAVAGQLLETFHQVRQSYMQEDSAAFSQLMETFLGDLYKLEGHKFVDPGLLELEQRYLVQHPFRLAAILFALGLVAVVITMLWMQKPGYILAWVFVAGGFLLQIYGLVCRSLIAGRPPVTNMYETVIWVAFGVITFALIFEAIYRCRYFLMGATPIAIISLLLADTQPEILNSAINPLVPVLRSNFWLTVHVLTITSSYAAFALALGVGHIILIGVMLGKKVSGDLHLYLYRALQIGVLLLAAGTILGGVWANYSWGRFWDWDPKETWALIALLSYLIVLHGRVAGWIRGFGMAVGSILCFLSVLMAWYGVNFVLGVGLHSYGFGTGGFQYVVGFVLAELAFIGAAWMRHKQLLKKPKAV